KEPGGAACALAADAEPKEAPALPELASSYALLRQTCDGFYLERACHVAAGLHELGLTQPHGDLATFVSRKRACDEGDDSSCAALTTTLRGPTGSRHQAACEALAAGNGGDPRACSAYAVMLQFGVGTTKDEAKADRMRTLACEKGAAASCDEIADDTWDEDSLASFTWYQRACVAGHPNGCEVSGRMRLYGESGVTTDVQGALADLRRGCDAHSHYACSTLGFGLYSGDATPIDPPGAWRAALSGCSLGSLDACSLVAFMMFDGIGTTKDVAGAVLLGSWTCLHGDADACEFLGDIYTNGEGVPKDEGRAAWAWARGCEMFDAISSDIEGAENTCCENVDEDAVETPIASSPLPTHRPASSWREPVSETVVIDDGPGPRPHPGPVSFGRAALSVGVSLGTQRSWTAASQASVIRFSLEVPLIRGLGVGADLDLVSDSRLRPKVARSYWRTTGFVNLAFGLPIRGPVYLSLGVGPGIGGFRAGPGTTNPIALSYGVHEFLQLGVRLDKFTAGLRLEQQQLWQTGSPDIDHVTGLYGIVGGSFD
ncbi:MAG TPA: tetratricopeptide repeat protein, partial [Myxococcota bacterium]|nr:tetratricopeptide repeat protein [Myxococcota bacterium]